MSEQFRFVTTATGSGHIISIRKQRSNGIQIVDGVARQEWEDVDETVCCETSGNTVTIYHSEAISLQFDVPESQTLSASTSVESAHISVNLLS